jgi:hypothetical protein
MAAVAAMLVLSIDVGQNQPNGGTKRLQPDISVRLYPYLPLSDKANDDNTPTARPLSTADT